MTNQFMPAGMMPPHPGPYGLYKGFCASCCHPASRCCCHRWECRKEGKELLVIAQPLKESATGDKEASHAKIANPAVSKAEVMHELLQAQLRAASLGGTTFGLNMASAVPFAAIPPGAAEPQETLSGYESTVIGGGCCSYLSIEYNFGVSKLPAAIVVMVVDSESTILSWIKVVKDEGYAVKQGIISTNPGARLHVAVVNVTARIRWCEVYSC